MENEKNVRFHHCQLDLKSRIFVCWLLLYSDQTDLSWPTVILGWSLKKGISTQQTIQDMKKSGRDLKGALSEEDTEKKTNEAGRQQRIQHSSIWSDFVLKRASELQRGAGGIMGSDRFDVDPT